jgi:hypothetical protein
MKNFFPPFAKLIALAACALSLGSCSRSEYAMLPKGSSYHGVTRVATPVPAATPATAIAPAAEPVVATAPVAVEAQAAATQSPASAAKATSRAAMPAVAVQSPTAVAAAPAPKLSLVQRLALSKVTRKMDKLMQKSGSVRQHDNTASTSNTAAISGNLRIGIILLLVGLLVGLLNGLIGTIIAIIGLIFIILWLLDQM